jgi:hypothetical protein
LTNPFRSFFDAGYKRLVPITTPNAPVSPTSSFARPGRQKALGKAPGVRRDDGLWTGVDWLKLAPTEADLDRWNSWQAGVGIRTGGGLVAVDIDTLHTHHADPIANAARTILGAAPSRIGNAPKLLLLYRCAEDLPYRRLRFDGGIVELLTEGKQFVAHGTHPVTGRPYEWKPHVYYVESLTPVTGQQLDQFFAHLATLLPAAEVETESSLARAAVDQAQLAGNPDTVAEAITALPNDHNFPSRDSYIRVGAALKAAVPDDDGYGLELFQEWAGRWTAGENDPDVVAADWRRLKPPFSVGAQYLYSLASEHGSFSTADAWFTAGASAGPVSAPLKTVWDEAPAETPQLPPIEWANLEAWHTTEAPRREWMVDNFIPREGVTLVYGDPGVGKTLIMHQQAVCAAAGIEWLKQRTRPARVMCVFCEDSKNELHRRHRDIMRSTGADAEAVSRNLRLVSRAGEDNLLVTFSRSNGTMQRTAFWHQLAQEIEDWGADLVIVDTLADVFGGSEIDRTQVNSFVKAGLGKLGGGRDVSVVALGHPSVAGRAEGRSGSTAWAGAARYRNLMRRPKGKEKGNLREFEGTKTNNARLGNLLQVEWKAGAFVVVASSTEANLNAFKESASVAVARLPTVEEREDAAVLAALGAARLQNVPLGLNAKAHQKYAPRVLRAVCGDIMATVRAEDEVVEEVLRRLLRSGRVRETTWRHPEHRYNVAGYEVVIADDAPPNVFN